MSYFFNRSFSPISMLVTAIMGAGMFSLPFVFRASGSLVTAIYLFVFALLAACVHLIYADVVMRSQAKHRHFSGYAKLYLGSRTGWFATIVVLATLLLTLTAYLILSTSFLHILIPSLPPLALLFLFWAIGTLCAFISIKGTALFDTATTTVTLGAIGVIFAYWAFFVPSTGISLPSYDPTQLLAPFGPLLFSLLGLPAIPALVSYTKKRSISIRSLKTAIVAGSLIPAIFYFLFILAIWMLSPFVSTDSISGLAATVPVGILLVLGVLGFVSLWDSYACAGRNAAELLRSEFDLAPWVTFAVVAILPPVLFFLGFQNFIAVINVVGGVLFSLWGILIVLAWKQAIAVHIPSVKFSTIHIPHHGESLTDRIPSFVPYVLLAIFAGGILYELLSFIKPF